MTRLLACAVLGFAWFLNCVSVALAYDLRTHERLTGAAFDASQELTGYFLDVGINPERKIDVAKATPPEELALYENEGAPRDWMIEGAIREDDYRRGCAEHRRKAGEGRSG